MSREEVLKLWRQRPFVPFRIVTVVGERINVWHPNLLLPGGNMITVGQPDPSGPPPLARDGTWLGYEDIARLEIIEPLPDMPNTPENRCAAVSHEELKRLKWQRPFQPFRIITLDRETYEVTDPGLFLLGKDEVTIGLPHPERPPPAARQLVWLGLEHIASAEPLETTT
jgi:hypothetical protein